MLNPYSDLPHKCWDWFDIQDSGLRVFMMIVAAMPGEPLGYRWRVGKEFYESNWYMPATLHAIDSFRCRTNHADTPAETNQDLREPTLY